MGPPAGAVRRLGGGAGGGGAGLGARLQAAGGFEHFVQIIEQNVDPDARETREQRFAFGLNCLLDGIAVHVAAMTPGESGKLAEQ
jgi:hypothetical protein